MTIDDLDVPLLDYDVWDCSPCFFPELRDTVPVSEDLSVTVYYMFSGVDGYMKNQLITELILGLVWRGSIAAMLHCTKTQRPMDVCTPVGSLIESAVVTYVVCLPSSRHHFNILLCRSLNSLQGLRDMSDVLYHCPSMPSPWYLLPLDPSVAASQD